MNFGCYLRAIREEHRVTLEAVSASTKIRRQLWIDLEANDLRRWPKERVYRQGYLRSYAKAVGVEPDALMVRFDAEFTEGMPPSAPTPAEVRPFPLRLVRNAAAVAIAAALLVAAGLNISDKRENAVAASSPPAAGAIQPFSRTSGPPSPPASTSSVDASNSESVSDASVTDVQGEIRVLSKPAGAWVTINGNGFGFTPLRVRYLPPGSYTVRVIQSGYKIGQTQVNLSAEQPTRTVSLALRENAGSTGPREARSGAAGSVR